MARRNRRALWSLLVYAFAVACGEERGSQPNHFADAERLTAAGQYTDAVAACKKALEADADATIDVNAELRTAGIANLVCGGAGGCCAAGCR